MAIEREYEGDATNKSFSGVDNALPYSNLNHSWKVKHQLCTKKKNLRFYSEDYLSVTLHRYQHRPRPQACVLFDGYKEPLVGCLQHVLQKVTCGHPLP